MRRFILPTIFLACAALTAGEAVPATPAATSPATTEVPLATGGVTLMASEGIKWKPQMNKADKVFARLAPKITDPADPKKKLGEFTIQFDIDAGKRPNAEELAEKREDYKKRLTVEDPKKRSWEVLDAGDVDNGFAFALRCTDPSVSQPNYLMFWAMSWPTDDRQMTFQIHVTYKDDPKVDLAKMRKDIGRLLASVRTGDHSPYAAFAAKAKSDAWVDKAAASGK